MERSSWFGLEPVIQTYLEISLEFVSKLINTRQICLYLSGNKIIDLTSSVEPFIFIRIVNLARVEYFSRPWPSSHHEDLTLKCYCTWSTPWSPEACDVMPFVQPRVVSFYCSQNCVRFGDSYGISTNLNLIIYRTRWGDACPVDKVLASEN